MSTPGAAVGRRRPQPCVAAQTLGDAAGSGPQRRIVLINRHGSALYSGMVPALIAGIGHRDAAAIDLRQLCDRAGVAFVQAEICGIDLHNRQLQLVDRPALAYGLFGGSGCRSHQHG